MKKKINPRSCAARVTFSEKCGPMMDKIKLFIEESERRMVANLNADIAGLPLPYPPEPDRCPHCGKEIDR